MSKIDPLEKDSVNVNETRESSEKRYCPTSDLALYELPALDLLEDRTKAGSCVDNAWHEDNKQKIEEIFNSLGIKIDRIESTVGPTITRYEIIPAKGVGIRSVRALGDDLAFALSVGGARIIAPIPGKGTIGIEVPNKNPQIVGIRSILSSEAYQNSKAELPIAMGSTITNEVYVADLAKLPHLLVFGATGTGKSVGLNTIITSLLYKKHPAELKFVFIDPKRVELTPYRKLNRHYLAALPGEDPVITDTSKVVTVLNSLCVEMDNRLDLLEKAGVRNIKDYNQKFISHCLASNEHRFLPYIVVVIDEFADLILTAGKEVENPVSRLAAVARAAGIHLIIATQRPTVNVITGGIKAKIPSRIAFHINQAVDSKTILGTTGANQLAGNGDMLFSQNGIIERVQCAYIDSSEVDAVVESISKQDGYEQPYYLPAELPASADSGDKQLADSSPLANWNGFSLHGDVNELDKIVSTPGLLDLDKKDILRVLEAEGDTLVVTGKADTIAEAMNIARVKIPAGIKITNMVIAIWAASLIFPMSEMAAVNNVLSEFDSEISVIWSVFPDEELGDSYKVVLLATLNQE